MSDIAPNVKRIVVHIVTGAQAGMRKIIGHIVVDDPTSLPAAFNHTEHGSVQHAGTFPRYILYRQFNPTQRGRFNELHPQQR